MLHIAALLTDNWRPPEQFTAGHPFQQPPGIRLRWLMLLEQQVDACDLRCNGFIASSPFGSRVWQQLLESLPRSPAHGDLRPSGSQQAAGERSHEVGEKIVSSKCQKADQALKPAQTLPTILGP
jgi:hypothetical protein